MRKTFPLAMKGSKSDGLKPNTPKSAPTIGETGPLFPRLHVNETEKAGPRAPPRNKMALYEQFTVPSHRFVQASRTPTPSAPYPQQQFPDQYHYTYLPYYMPPSAPYANGQPGIPVYAQPGYAANSCGMSTGSTVVNEEEPQKVPLPQKSDRSSSHGLSRVMTKDVASSGSKSVPDKKTRDSAGVIGSTSSSDIIHEKRPPKFLYMLPVGPNKHRPENVNASKTVSSTERQSSKDITGRLHEALNAADVVSGCDGSVSRNSRLASCTEKSQTNSRLDIPEHDRNEDPSWTDADHVDDQEGTASLSSPVEFCHESASVDAGFQTESRGFNQSIAEPAMSDENMTSIKCADSMREDLCCSPSRNVQERIVRNDPSMDVDKGDGNSCVFSSPAVAKNQEQSSGESKNSSGTVSQPSQQATAKVGYTEDSAVSMLISVSTRVIKPKDVIELFGQQQFWKARKTLLRQQRIFSDQVFQLHKLIKVQQLLAETPGTLMDEEMHFGVLEDSEESPRSNLLGASSPPPDKSQKLGSIFKKPQKGEASEAGFISSSTDCNQNALKHDIESNSTPPPFSPGGVSAWGYPSLGMGQWFNPMATQGRPFLYPPYGGTFPSGQPFAGSYGSPVMGQVSPMVPFGIPYFGQYGSTPGSNSPADHAAHPIKDLPGSWNFMQQNAMNFNQGVPNDLSKAVPAGSGASVNQSSTKAPNVSGAQYQWGATIQQGLSSTQQCENSSPFVVGRLNSKVSSSTPSASNSKKSLSNQKEVGRTQNVDLGSAFRSQTSNDTEDSRRRDRETISKWFKYQRDSAPVSVTRETIEEGSPESFCNALDLFPVVPSLSPNGKSVPRPASKAEECQGRVIKVVPRPAVAASQSTAGILLSLQRERQQ